jgi:lauroyl/myristoyl acyltransferase
VEEPFRVAATEDANADIRQAVERFARLLEQHLRRDPGQWAVLEDFWRVHACGEG